MWKSADMVEIRWGAVHLVCYSLFTVHRRFATEFAVISVIVASSEIWYVCKWFRHYGKMSVIITIFLSHVMSTTRLFGALFHSIRNALTAYKMSTINKTLILPKWQCSVVPSKCNFILSIPLSLTFSLWLCGAFIARMPQHGYLPINVAKQELDTNNCSITLTCVELIIVKMCMKKL